MSCQKENLVTKDWARDSSPIDGGNHSLKRRAVHTLLQLQTLIDVCIVAVPWTAKDGIQEAVLGVHQRKQYHAIPAKKEKKNYSAVYGALI